MSRYQDDHDALYLNVEESEALYDVLFTRDASGREMSWIDWGSLGTYPQHIAVAVFNWRQKQRGELPIYGAQIERAIIQASQASGHLKRCHAQHLVNTLLWLLMGGVKKGNAPGWPCRDMQRSLGAEGPWKELDHEKAYNAHRLEQEYGGEWSKDAFTEKNGVRYQDHYMTLPDGSIWRPRHPSQYYSTATGKVMMVCAQIGMSK